MVVYLVPIYQKSNPIGKAVKVPSSTVPVERPGEVAPLRAVKVPLDEEKV
jgi:hypothetical protein